MIRKGEITIHNTHVGIWENDVDEKDYKQVYDKIIRHFRSRDFKVFRCPFAKKHYRCISSTIHRGVLNHLEFKMQLSGRHIAIEFFQNINKSNPNGGEYDFDKFNRMPYLMQKKFIVETSHLIKMLVEFYGYNFSKKLLYAPISDGYRQRVIKAIDGIHPTKEPLKRFNDSWGSKRFNRDESGWPIQKEFEGRDRDGVRLKNGMIRYFRDRNGYMRRATIYTNMNSMWQTIYGPGRRDCTYLAAWELFTPQKTDNRKRWFPDEYREKVQKKVMEKTIKEMNFEKAVILRDMIYKPGTIAE